MKALTIWQPWASLILVGAKPYEFRSWQPPRWLIGKRLAIHAGARGVKRAEVRDLIRALSGTNGIDPPCLHKAPALTLLQRVDDGLGRSGSDLLESEPPFRLPLSCIVATATVGEPKRGDLVAAEFGIAHGNDSDRAGTFNWGWPLLDLQPLLPPAEARGAQGLWDWNEREAS